MTTTACSSCIDDVIDQCLILVPQRHVVDLATDLTLHATDESFAEAVIDVVSHQLILVYPLLRVMDATVVTRLVMLLLDGDAPRPTGVLMIVNIRWRSHLCLLFSAILPVA